MYIEKIGYYDPYKADPQGKVKLDLERYRYWLDVGAKPTEAVERVLKHAGLISKGLDVESAPSP
jgi:small subunit ribosomal protein S16